MELGLCDNGKTYISIMHSKIISIIIVISINDNKSTVHVFCSKIALYTATHMEYTLLYVQS